MNFLENPIRPCMGFSRKFIVGIWVFVGITQFFAQIILVKTDFRLDVGIAFKSCLSIRVLIADIRLQGQSWAMAQRFSESPPSKQGDQTLSRQKIFFSAKKFFFSTQRKSKNFATRGYSCPQGLMNRCDPMRKMFCKK